MGWGVGAQGVVGSIPAALPACSQPAAGSPAPSDEHASMGAVQVGARDFFRACSSVDFSKRTVSSRHVLKPEPVPGYRMILELGLVFEGPLPARPNGRAHGGRPGAIKTKPGLTLKREGLVNGHSHCSPAAELSSSDCMAGQ